MYSWMIVLLLTGAFEYGPLLWVKAYDVLAFFFFCIALAHQPHLPFNMEDQELHFSVF